MKRIAFFTDIHANIEALKTILNDIKKEGIDSVFHLGDSIAIGPNPKETLDLLIESKIVLLRGNHEDYYIHKNVDESSSMSAGEAIHQKWTHKELGDGYREFLKSLPYKLVLEVEGLNLYLCHYSFEENDTKFVGYKNLEKEMTEDKADLFFDGKEFDVFLYGHYHSFSDLQSETSGRRYINLGSAGAHHGNYTRYTIIEIDGKNFNVIHKNLKYDKNKVIKTIREKKVPGGEFIIRNFYGIME